MADLDSKEEIAKIDTKNVLGSIDALSDQCLHAWEDASKVEVPDYYKDVQNIVMCGMGGSGLGARVIESVYAAEILMPLVRVNDYHLPGFVDLHSLVICSSYSGETEETVQNAKEAIEKKAKWMAIGTGNSLIELAEKEGVPFYKIEPKFNPSNQPRMAIGYSILGQLVLASKADLFKIDKGDIDKITSTMNDVRKRYSQSVDFANNDAKKLASSIKDRVCLFMAGGHLVGATHVLNNQMNENSKNISFDFQIPEINHHLMEGLAHPTKNSENIAVVFVNSTLYEDRIKQRVEITKEVVSKNNIPIYEINLTSSTKISQSFELIQFGAYVNFYLSVLYDLDPAPIQWVDYFKERLGQPLGKQY